MFVIKIKALPETDNYAVEMRQDGAQMYVKEFATFADAQEHYKKILNGIYKGLTPILDDK